MLHWLCFPINNKLSQFSKNNIHKASDAGTLFQNWEIVLLTHSWQIFTCSPYFKKYYLLVIIFSFSIYLLIGDILYTIFSTVKNHTCRRLFVMFMYRYLVVLLICVVQTWVFFARHNLKTSKVLRSISHPAIFLYQMLTNRGHPLWIIQLEHQTVQKILTILFVRNILDIWSLLRFTSSITTSWL